VYKYREGKIKRTLKRELKVLEIVGSEAFVFIGLKNGIKRGEIRGGKGIIYYIFFLSYFSLINLIHFGDN